MLFLMISKPAMEWKDRAESKPNSNVSSKKKPIMYKRKNLGNKSLELTNLKFSIADSIWRHVSRTYSQTKFDHLRVNSWIRTILSV